MDLDELVMVGFAFAIGVLFIVLGVRERRRRPGSTGTVLIALGSLAVLGGLAIIVLIRGLSAGWSPN
jgi:hypothetical protein